MIMKIIRYTLLVSLFSLNVYSQNNDFEVDIGMNHPIDFSKARTNSYSASRTVDVRNKPSGFLSLEFPQLING